MYLDHVYIDAHIFSDEKVLQQDRKYERLVLL